MAATPLADAFLEHLHPEARAESFASNQAASERALRDFVERGRAAWPELRVEPRDLVVYVAARFQPGQTLEATHAEGLYLAFACARGSERAVAAFGNAYGAVMDACYRRLGFTRHAEEISQRVMRSIFVHDGQSGPAIVNYTGRGSLANWVRVVTVREAYRVTRGERNLAQREVGGIDERIMDRAVNDEANPELLHLKRDYRSKFKASFQQAFERLTHRERNVLRYQYLDGLNLEQIGTIYNASRATVARWRAGARAKLLAETRKIMRDEHRVPLDEFDGAMRLIESAMDVSLSRLLNAVIAREER
jgi:RNA polymerase sigma-70 factor